jgi:hypothetical protein
VRVIHLQRECALATVHRPGEEVELGHGPRLSSAMSLLMAEWPTAR